MLCVHTLVLSGRAAGASHGAIILLLLAGSRQLRKAEVLVERGDDTSLRIELTGDGFLYRCEQRGRVRSDGSGCRHVALTCYMAAVAPSVCML
jgi:hypothetical protein